MRQVFVLYHAFSYSYCGLEYLTSGVLLLWHLVWVLLYSTTAAEARTHGIHSHFAGRQIRSLEVQFFILLIEIQFRRSLLHLVRFHFFLLLPQPSLPSLVSRSWCCLRPRILHLRFPLSQTEPVKRIVVWTFLLSWNSCDYFLHWPYNLLGRWLFFEFHCRSLLHLFLWLLVFSFWNKLCHFLSIEVIDRRLTIRP